MLESIQKYRDSIVGYTDLEKHEDLGVNGWVISAHLRSRLLSCILFHQALSILDIRPTMRVRLLEGHINEEALKVIWNF